LSDAYEEQKLEKDERTVMHFHPAIAPIKAGIFPLVKKDGLPEVAHKIEETLRKHFPVFYDESAAVGRRYRRQDEIGTPYCITVDYDTMQNETVTVRERDAMTQERIKIDELFSYIYKKITDVF